MVERTHASSGGSIEGCCGSPFGKADRQSVPVCSEVVCRVGEHQHHWHISVHEKPISPQEATSNYSSPLPSLPSLSTPLSHSHCLIEPSPLPIFLEVLRLRLHNKAQIVLLLTFLANSSSPNLAPRTSSCVVSWSPALTVLIHLGSSTYLFITCLYVDTSPLAHSLEPS